MKLYRAKIRLSGSILNEVWVQDVTAAELLLLTEIHKGGDNFPLAEVVQTGSVMRSDQRERARLRLKYLDWNLGNGEKLIRDVLGMPNVSLPQEYQPPVFDPQDDEFDPDASEPAADEPEEIEQLAKPVDIIKPQRTRIPRGGLKPEDVK